MNGQFFFELIGPLVFLALAVGFAAIRWSLPHLVSAGFFAFSYFFRSCGFMADYLRPAMPPDLAIFATVVPFLAAGLAFCAGMFHLYEARVPRRMLGAIAAVVVLGSVIWFRYVDDNLLARIVVLNGAAVVVLVWLAVALHSRMTRGIDRLLQVLLVTNAVQFVVRTAIMLWMEGGMLTETNYATSLTAVSLRFSITAATLAIAATLFAIYCMEVFSRLTASSRTDPLTGVLNRRGFDACVAAMENRLAAGESGHGLIFADIDRFKSINDRFGHHAGDAVIARIACVLQGTARDGDVVARWGGEEFIILIAHGGEHIACLYAEAVRVAVEQMRHDCLESGSVTISFGVAEWRHGDRLREVCRRADDALYHAKQVGRNCVRTAGDAAPESPVAAVA